MRLFKKNIYKFDYSKIEYHDIIDNILILFQNEYNRKLYKQLIYNLYDYTYRLPASQTNHHDYPFGLFHHSLETTLIQMQKIDKDIINYPGTKTRNTFKTWMHQDIGFLYHGILTLYHDCGKIINYSVTRNKIQWNIFNNISLREFIMDYPETPIYYNHLNNVRHEQFNNIIFFIINKEIINDIYRVIGYMDMINIYQYINFQQSSDEINSVKKSDAESAERSLNNENIIEKFINSLNDLYLKNKIKIESLFINDIYTLITIDLLIKISRNIGIDEDEVIHIIKKSNLLYEFNNEYVFYLCKTKAEIKKKIGKKCIIFYNNKIWKNETNKMIIPDEYNIYTSRDRKKVKL